MKVIARVPGDPSAPAYHRFHSRHGEHLLIVPHSSIFDLTGDGAAGFDEGMMGEQAAALNALLDGLGETDESEAPLDDVVAPAPQAISLNVSSSCNLSCSYCYAARGAFGGAQPNPMDWETARGAIDALLARADATRPVTIGFLGGEPFANRALIHRSIHYASGEGRSRGLDIRFSVTTNGTLLSPEDIALIRAHRMAVTVSIDGGARVQDRQRPSGGRAPRGSFAALTKAVAPLLANPGRAQVAARATVTRLDLDLQQHFEDILALGFSEVGFSPLRLDKDGGGALKDGDWLPYLDALACVAKGELARARRGLPIRLSNLAIALKQIARGASSPYPCGAGGGYFSVAADGRWYACHRAIGRPEFEMGDSAGLDETRRGVFLEERHVHAQDACRRCWARYLCSGACHQEASARNDSSCGFVRGWLEFCLGAYCELSGPLHDAPLHREEVLI
jgi:uncharacterized protein